MHPLILEYSILHNINYRTLLVCDYPVDDYILKQSFLLIALFAVFDIIIDITSLDLYRT